MRSKKKEKRIEEPDLTYGSLMVSKFINCLMQDGKKEVARKVMMAALEKTKVQSGKEALEIFDLAMKNVAPKVEVKSKRIGGANYQVPIEVRADRKVTLAIRWLIGAARSKKGRPMAEKLAEEFILAAKNEGTAIKKRNDVHRMAEANKAFAHFAW